MLVALQCIKMHLVCALSLSCSALVLAVSSLTGQMQVLPKLQSKLPIQRARMRLKLLAPASASRDVLHMLQDRSADIESQDLSGQHDSQVCKAFMAACAAGSFPFRCSWSGFTSWVCAP